MSKIIDIATNPATYNILLTALGLGVNLAGLWLGVHTIAFAGIGIMATAYILLLTD